MKNQISALAVLSLVGATAVHAQSASTRAQQPQAAARPPATRITTTAAQAVPYGAANKQVIPANLFGIEDRAIIIVGGRQVAAGDVKRQLAAELRKSAIPTATIRSRSRLPANSGAPVRDLPLGGFNFPGSINRPVRPAIDRVKATTTVTPRDAAVGNGGRPNLSLSPVPSIAAAREYCRTHPPEISKIRGVVTPNGRFTIEGLCFGDQTGAVEVIGQFAGGSMRLVFERWNDVEIGAFVPAVSGAADHTIALTVVRLDKTRSPAAQARFVATRAIVPVPERFWTPNADYFQIDVDQGGGDIFSGFKVWGAGAESRSTPFSLAVNPACALDRAGWSSTAGRIEAFNGWENGPPNQANVEVVWTPRCTTQTTNYIFASSSQRICSVGFTLSASASCPLGVAP